MGEAVQAFEACWVSQFWYPESVHGDKAFQVGDFKTYADSLGIKIRPVPPRRHNKNAIESNHRVIRSTFLRLKSAAGDSFDPNVAAYKSVSISNSLYGNDTMSVFEPTKGFSKPIHSKPAELTITDDVLDAHEKLQARRKLALILKSKTVREIPLHVGDSVEIIQKKQHEKRGKWSSAKTILSFDPDARSIIVPGKKEIPLPSRLKTFEQLPLKMISPCWSKKVLINLTNSCMISLLTLRRIALISLALWIVPWIRKMETVLLILIFLLTLPMFYHK